MNGSYTTYRNQNNDLLTIFSGTECDKPEPSLEEFHFETFMANHYSMTDTNFETLADLLNHLTNWQKTDKCDSYLNYKIASNKDLRLADVFKLIENDLDNFGYYARFISMSKKSQKDDDNNHYFINNYSNDQDKGIIGLVYISKEDAAKHNWKKDDILKHMITYLEWYSAWLRDESYSYEYESHIGNKDSSPSFIINDEPMAPININTYELKVPVLYTLEKNTGETIPNLWKEVKLVQVYQKWEDVV